MAFRRVTFFFCRRSTVRRDCGDRKMSADTRAERQSHSAHHAAEPLDTGVGYLLMTKLAIIDYGVGNLRSVEKTFAATGCNAVISSDEKICVRRKRLVLPGVGAFGAA